MIHLNNQCISISFEKRMKRLLDQHVDKFLANRHISWYHQPTQAIDLHYQTTKVCALLQVFCCFAYFVETIQMYKFKALRNCFRLEPYKEIFFPAI